MAQPNEYTLTSSGMDIPQWAFDSIARSLLPDIQRFYDTEEGQRMFAEVEAELHTSGDTAQ